MIYTDRRSESKDKKHSFCQITRRFKEVVEPIPTNNVFVENMFVITLDRSEESRYLPLLAKIETQKVTYPITKIEAIDGRGIDAFDNPNNLTFNTYACMLSHIKAIKTAQKMDLPCVLIIEDDINFAANFTNRLDNLMQWLPANWDAVWLGGAVAIRPDDYNEHFVRVRSNWGGFGYIVRNTIYQKFIDGLISHKLDCDNYYRATQSKINCFRPKANIIFHLRGYSDRQEKVK